MTTNKLQFRLSPRGFRQSPRQTHINHCPSPHLTRTTRKSSFQPSHTWPECAAYNFPIQLRKYADAMLRRRKDNNKTNTKKKQQKMRKEKLVDCENQVEFMCVSHRRRYTVGKHGTQWHHSPNCCCCFFVTFIPIQSIVLTRKYLSKRSAQTFDNVNAPHKQQPAKSTNGE